MYNTAMSFITAIIIALFFFFGGCIQLGAYIAQTTVQDVPVYVSGLMSSAGPLAVAAILFMLIEIRLHGIRTTDSVYEVDAVPGKPISQHAAQPAGDGTYFRTDDTGVPASEQLTPHPSRAPFPQSPPTRTPFAAPLPVEQGEGRGEADQTSDTAPASPSRKEDDSGLNFFKL